MASDGAAAQAGAWQALTAGNVFDVLKWVAPLLGGAAALVHFWRIGYAPSLSLSDLGTVIGAFLLFSFYALTLVLLVLLAPAGMIAMLVRCHVLPAPPKRRAAGDASKGLRSFRPAANGARKQKVLRPRKRDHLPPADRPSVVMFEIGTAGVLALAAILSTVALYDRCSTIGRVPMPALFYLGLATIMVVFFGADTDWTRKRLVALRRTRVRLPLFFLMYLGYWMALLALTLNTLPTLLSIAGTVYALMAAAMILMLHWASYASLRAPSSKRNTTLAIGCLMVVAYAQLPMSVVDNAVERFGLGNMRNVSLVTTRQGCDIARAASPQFTCAPVQGSEGAYRLEKADLLTRIGPQVLLAPPGGLGDRSLPRFTLAADQVLSWSRASEIKPSSATCGASK